MSVNAGLSQGFADQVTCVCECVCMPPIVLGSIPVFLGQYSINKAPVPQEVLG